MPPDGKVEEAKNEVLAKLNELEHTATVRHATLVARIEEVAADARTAIETSELAKATAIQAKHAAGKVSIDSEGGDQSIMAELGSMKVAVGANVEELKGQLSEHAERLKNHDEARASERKIDARARRFWRVAQPAIIAAVLAALNRLTFLLAPPGTLPVEPPIKIDPPKAVPTLIVDGGASR